MPPQITRSRPSFSCLTCRRRKVKCERQHPTCDNCIKANEECRYATSQPTATQKKDQQGAAPAKRTAEKMTEEKELNYQPSRKTAGRFAFGPVSPPYFEEPLSRDRSNLSSASKNQDQSAGATVGSSPKTFSWHTTRRKNSDDGLEIRVNRLNGIVEDLRDHSRTDQMFDSFFEVALNEQNCSRTSSRDKQNNCDARKLVQDISNCSRLGPLPEPVSNSTHKESIEYRQQALQRKRKLIALDDEYLGNPGYLRLLGGGRSRYVGNAFWALVSNDRCGCNELLNDNFDHQEHTHQHSICSNGAGDDLCPNIDKTDYASLSKLALVLPPKQICDMLFNSFVIGIHPLTPLVHLPTLQKEYRLFWKICGSNRDVAPKPQHTDLLQLLPLLFAVLLGGIVCTPPGLLRDTLREGYTPISLRAHLERATIIALKIYQFPRLPTLNSMIAFLLLQNFSHCHDEIMDSQTMVATLIIAAQKMGLHRDGSHFNLSRVECEVRRRVWWYLLQLDVQSALSSGLPLSSSTSADSFDTWMVSEYQDEDISPALNSPKRCSTAMLFAVGRYEAASVTREIIAQIHGITTPTKSDLARLDEKVTSLRSRLDVIIRRIPTNESAEQGHKSLSSINPLNAGNPYDRDFERSKRFSSWSRYILSITYKNVRLTLYQPFLKSSINNAWNGIWTSSIQICKAILQDFILIANSSAFGLYKWYCPGELQPFQACMIILTYLYERPITTNSSTDRDLLDEVFNTFRCFSCNACHGQQYENTCIAKSRKSWRVLEKFKNKVYARAGWPIHDGSELSSDVSLSDFMVISDFAEDSITEERSTNQTRSVEQSPLSSADDALFLEPEAIPTGFLDKNFSLDMPVNPYFRPASRDQRDVVLSVLEDSPMDVTNNHDSTTLPYNTLNTDSIPLSPKVISETSNTGFMAKQGNPSIETKSNRGLQLRHSCKSKTPYAVEDEFDFAHLDAMLQNFETPIT